VSENDAGRAERDPEALKDACEKAAKAQGLSVNSWALRCMERCLKVPAQTA